MSQIRKEKKSNKTNPSLLFPHPICDKWKICMINLYPRQEFPSFHNSHKNQLDLILRIVVCKYLTIFFLQKSLFLSLPFILSFLTSDSFVSSTSINLSRMSAHHMHLTLIAFFHFWKSFYFVVDKFFSDFFVSNESCNSKDYSFPRSLHFVNLFILILF